MKAFDLASLDKTDRKDNKQRWMNITNWNKTSRVNGFFSFSLDPMKQVE